MSDLVLQEEVWRRFIEAKYFKEARTCNEEDMRRQTCNRSKDCNNRYCLQCMVGGLCPRKFLEGYEHNQHPMLQVRMYYGRPGVRATDLEQFLGQLRTKHIQKYISEKKEGCLLTKLPKTGASHRTWKECRGCEMPIPETQWSRKNSGLDYLVCSLECLVTAGRKYPYLGLFEIEYGPLEHKYPELNLFKMEDGSIDHMFPSLNFCGIEDGAIEHMYLESQPFKIKDDAMEFQMEDGAMEHTFQQEFAVTTEEEKIWEDFFDIPWYEIEFHYQ